MSTSGTQLSPIPAISVPPEYAIRSAFPIAFQIDSARSPVIYLPAGSLSLAVSACDAQGEKARSKILLNLRTVQLQLRSSNTPHSTFLTHDAICSTSRSSFIFLPHTLPLIGAYQRSRTESTRSLPRHTTKIAQLSTAQQGTVQTQRGVADTRTSVGTESESRA